MDSFQEQERFRHLVCLRPHRAVAVAVAVAATPFGTVASFLVPLQFPLVVLGPDKRQTDSLYTVSKQASGF